MHSQIKISLLVGASLFAVPGVASAQIGQAGQTAPGAPEASAEPVQTSSVQEGDIIVTANKREQKLNDVGITVAVLGGDELKSKQIVNLQDLAQSIPSLSYTNSANGTPVYTLRGIGFYETSLGAYPTVSVYVDEAPLPFAVLTRHSAYDLERVEVLKGPQGTLFGQNSTGGAINYVAAKPTKDLQAGLNLTYGRFNQIIGEGYVSGPLSENLSARVAGRIERMDGWQISNSRPGDRNGRIENYMGRAIVNFEPTDTIRFSLNVNGWKDKSDPQTPQFIARNLQNPVPNPAWEAAQLSPMKARASDWTPGLPFANNRLWQTALRGDIDLTDSITLTSLTSYVDYKQNQADEGDGIPPQNLDLPSDRGRIKSFFQELRLGNGGQGSFRWVAGANIESSKVDQIVDLNYSASSSNSTLGTLGYPISSAHYTSFQKMRNYAGFVNGELDLSDTLTVKGGVRYTNARTKAQICNRDLSGTTTNVGSFFYDVLLGGTLGRYDPSYCFAINDQPETIGGVAPGMPGQYNATLHEDNVSWKAGVDYKPRPGMLIYANVGRGYKAGSFPNVSASTFAQYLPVTQESVMSYEGGFKATLLDRTLQLNGAGFYYDYSDKQLRSKIDAAPFGILDVLQNIPKSTIYGFELEATMRPTRGLVVNAAYTYIHTKIDEFSGINGGGVVSDFAGSGIPFTPKHQVAVSADYSFPVGSDLQGFVGGTVTMRSDTFSVIGGEQNPPAADPSNFAVYGIDGYTLVDARLGIKGPNDRWQVSVFGKNIFNEYYWNNVVSAFDTIVRYTGMPATYGVSVGFKY
ncbi:TonB-dependent receptor [Novosphingobium sp. 9U]|uniref:TonB-dependent receptor n=1 Tax=Novosphingobium sp. 9U TaxID=2653158 RepID=UPI0012F3DD04|nr:TonB-dependent receptor [Novosphingobium sp. 9U]VWX50031.1 TonB-dependent receptor [Novosphingobium sp. 9U]